MRAIIYTNKIEVMRTLVTMVATNGCSFTQMHRFDEMLIKGHDLMIVDLDNIADCPSIKTVLSQYPEILKVAISISGTLLDEYRGICNTNKKPFNQNDLSKYKKEIELTIGSHIGINKDVERIYDRLGKKLFETFDNLPLEDQISLFKNKINSSPAKIESEKDFFEKTKLNNLVIKPIAPIDIRLSNPKLFENKALLLYRIKKLQALNISPQEINLRISELNEQRRKPSDTASTLQKERKDVLSQLIAGAFSQPKTTPTPQQPTIAPPIPIVKPKINSTSETSAIKSNGPQIDLGPAPIITLPVGLPIATAKDINTTPIVTSEASTLNIGDFSPPKIQLPDNIPTLKTPKTLNPIATTVSENKVGGEVIKDNKSGPLSIMEKMRKRLISSKDNASPPEYELGEIIDSKMKPPRK